MNALARPALAALALLAADGVPDRRHILREDGRHPKTPEMRAEPVCWLERRLLEER